MTKGGISKISGWNTNTWISKKYSPYNWRTQRHFQIDFLWIKKDDGTKDEISSPRHLLINSFIEVGRLGHFLVKYTKRNHQEEVASAIQLPMLPLVVLKSLWGFQQQQQLIAVGGSR